MIPTKQLPKPLQALLRHPDKVEAFVKVKCNNEQHWVAMIDGALVLLNHNYYREQALLALGGPQHFCMQLMQDWKLPWSLRTPKPLVMYWSGCSNKRLARQAAQFTDCSSLAAGSRLHDEDTGTEWQKTYMRIRLLLMYRCRYFRLRGLPWQLSITLADHPEGWGIRKYGANIEGDYASFGMGKDKFQIQLFIPFGWLSHVWKRGWAIIEDQLVLNMEDVSHDNNSGIAVILAIMGSLNTTTACRVEVARSKDMKPLIIKWL